MNKQNDYKRVMALGSWLERLLDYPWSQYEIEQLADDALNLLNIDYVRKDDDLFINSILGVIKRCELSDIDPPECDDSDRKLINLDLQMMLHYLFYICDSLVALEEHPDMPWVVAILQESCETNPEISLLDRLISSYNDIREILVIKQNQLMITKKMVFPRDNPYRDGLQWVRMPGLISHIIIEFLTAGGRDYCSICQNCGKFIIAKRKGRRHFCDGACRIAHKRMEERLSRGECCTTTWVNGVKGRRTYSKS